MNNTQASEAASSPPAIFLMGATATGKTALSLSLADALNAEIISVDSALVYRQMDIGTAKPSAEERAAAAHHLIDICDPWDCYSAARFVEESAALIEDIHGRGKRALLVGGTMLYFKALEQGIAQLPDADESLRRELLAEAEQKGWPALHERLAQVDAEAAQRIHPNDPQRIQRALEVFSLTGQPMSALLSTTQSPLVQAPVKFALVPEDRAWLHERIQRRFALMLEQDFLEEVRALKADPRLHADLPSMRSVGYRQAWDYLEHMNQETGHSSADWVAKAVAATRQLAKRQLTWLRGMENVTTIACDQCSVNEQHRRLCEQLVSS